MKRPRVIVNAAPVGAPAAREVQAHGATHALTPLGDAVNGALYWEQPRVFRREWRLVSDRGEHMLIHGHGITRRKLVAETAQATWMLTRSWGGSVTLADRKAASWRACRTAGSGAAGSSCRAGRHCNGAECGSTTACSRTSKARS